MKHMIFFIALVASFVSTSQEASAQRSSSREKAPAQQCFEQITRVPRFRNYGLEIRRFCEPMNNRLQNHCLEVLTADRIFALRDRGISWTPGYDTLSLCGQIQSLDQHRAVQALIRDYGLRLKASEMEIATRATDRQMAECFISRVSYAKSASELESCVAPRELPRQEAPVQRPSVQQSRPTQQPAVRPAPQATRPQAIEPAKPVFSPELSQETFFQ